MILLDSTVPMLRNSPFEHVIAYIIHVMSSMHYMAESKNVFLTGASVCEDSDTSWPVTWRFLTLGGLEVVILCKTRNTVYCLISKSIEVK